MRGGIPTIEVPDNTDFPCVRRPHPEASTLLFSGIGEMSAQFVVGPEIPPFVEKVNVLLAEQADIRTARIRRFDRVHSGYLRLVYRNETPCNGYVQWFAGSKMQLFSCVLDWIFLSCLCFALSFCGISISLSTRIWSPANIVCPGFACTR